MDKIKKYESLAIMGIVCLNAMTQVYLVKRFETKSDENFAEHVKLCEKIRETSYTQIDNDDDDDHY